MLTVVLFKVALFIVGVVNDKHEIAFEDVEFKIDFLLFNDFVKSEPFNEIVGTAND